MSLSEVSLEPLNADRVNIDRLAVAVDISNTAFNQVGDAFNDFVAHYRWQAPQLAAYQQSWKGYMGRWSNGIRESNDRAAKSAAILGEYIVMFAEMIENVKTSEEKDEAVERLNAFEKDHPIELPFHDSQLFVDLRRVSQGFQEDVRSFLQRTGIEAVRLAFDTSRGYFEIMQNTLDQLANAWAMWRADSQMLAERLERAVESHAVFIFRAVLKHCQAMASLLKPLLAAYETEVHI